MMYVKYSLQPHSWHSRLGLGVGLQGLYSATNCADNIQGRFTIIRQIKLQEKTHSQI